MKSSKKRLISILILTVSIISILNNVYAHSGRTDSNGGHKDKNNVSGLGAYHYHCGGNPAHLHTNGLCPYSPNQNTAPSSSSSTPQLNSNNTDSSSNEILTQTKIEVTGIEINDKIESMQIGERKMVIATIKPNNATDRNFTWKSSDENVATVNESGEIIAINYGTVNITATATNGKTDTMTINIKEKESIVTSTVSVPENEISNNASEESDPLSGMLTLGVLGGGGYWIYKKIRKSKG